MNYLPLAIITALYKKWIASCQTYEQLTTMEKLIDRYVLSRYADPGYDVCLTILKQDIQLQQLSLQINEQNNRIQHTQKSLRFYKK